MITLDRYEIGELLGVGTVGTIHAATDRQSQQRVAIKKLNQRVSKDPLILARFKREMHILGRLRHPNIVAYFGDGKDGEELFYVMELVDGGTVKSVLTAGGPLPWNVVVDLAIQICSALQCAHNHGVVHRDLKPGNLFLSKSGELKLGDFGIARDLTRADLTEQGFTVGTHAYMAPEQIRGEQSVSAKADLYALGCCLFEMLTNRKPFSGENYARLFDQHLKAKPPSVHDIVSGVPEPLGDAINSLLEKDPDQRPFNARYVQAEMLKLVSNSDTSEGDSPEPSRSAPDPEAREILISRISNRNLSPVAAPVDLSRIGAVFAAVLVAVIGAFVLRAMGN